ncbi:hypothetical protein KK062_22390 [Fulvivirgaceae bacterium PWU5]|uniref:Uncharacterized protein n=1 Tax=Dawidia cretensis TaxID=2782350 RepID=A0AAP2E2S8_9BACT|nr:hypothetical protein [Dawidia cretensis]MBT1711009.1 hypothetical protein [Dawidia cretensis]
MLCLLTIGLNLFITRIKDDILFEGAISAPSFVPETPANVCIIDGYLGFIDYQKFYQIFNQVLTDHRSPYRLHLVPAEMEFFPGNYQYFGIIAMTQPQASALDRGFSLFGIVHEESFDNALTTDEIRPFIRFNRPGCSRISHRHR